MPEYLIDSLDDPRLEPYRELKRTNMTRWSGRFIAEGLRVVERLLDSDFEVDSVLTSQTHRHRLPADLPDRCCLLTVSQSLAEQIVGYRFHAGVLAVGRRPPEVALPDWLCRFDSPRLFVGCPRTTDPDNLGTIIRVAAAFGADGLLVGRSSADPFSRRTLRVSMGTAFSLPIFQSSCFAEDLELLRAQSGVQVVASLLSEDAVELSTAPRPERLLLLLGNEADGLDPALADRADLRVRIPMAGGVDSLNVGIAAGILLHEFTSAFPESAG